MTAQMINVAVIDDNEIDRYLARRALRQFRQVREVAEFGDGSSAVSAFETIRTPHPDTAPPIVVLLDINMPKMSGFDLLERLSTVEPIQTMSTEDLAVFMLTPSIHARDIDRLSKFKFVKGHIEKPIDEIKLHSVLRRQFPEIFLGVLR